MHPLPMGLGMMYRRFRVVVLRRAPLPEYHRREDAGAGRGVRMHVRSPEAPSRVSPQRPPCQSDTRRIFDPDPAHPSNVTRI